MLLMLRGFIVPRFLGAYAYGIISYLNMIMGYAAYSDLGVGMAVGVETPTRVGAGDTEGADRAKRVGFTFLLVTGAIFGAGFLVSSVWPGRDPTLALGMKVFAVVVIFDCLYKFLMIVLRAEKNFARANLAQVVIRGANVFIVIGLTWKYRLNGMYAALLINSVMTFAFIVFAGGGLPKLLMERPMFAALFRRGFPLALSGVGLAFMSSVDRIMVSRMLGLEALGVYSIGVVIASYLQEIPVTLSKVVEPHIYEDFGKWGERERLASYLGAPSMIMTAASCAILGAATIAAPFLVMHILPAFRETLAPLQILLVATFFLAFSRNPNTVVVALNRHLTLVLFQVACIAAGAGLNWWFISSGRGITGVALAALVNYSLYGTMIFVFSCSLTGLSAGETAARYFKNILMGAYLLLPGLALNRFLAYEGRSVSADAAAFAIKTAIYLVVCAPVFFYAYKAVVGKKTITAGKEPF